MLSRPIKGNMRWRSWRPSVLMLEMNGLTFVERFRATNSSTPILIVSGTDLMTNIAQVLLLGVRNR
ncbi:MAG: Regulator of RpoS [Sodalis sp.]|nr:MAG: Regulator of RpoS [Sodalis sp.]